ncbi:metallophosphoesterase family protein [Pediococcus siamensis]|uniref:metallophosphoesterase family protein n=1 Tax=Pediococcus siamensis TaxID=381829 RepID=UPI0039A13C08
MKFIHAADIHLDSPFKGLQKAPDKIWQLIHQSTFKAFENLVTTAIDEQVDFVLLVGDLFDQVHHSIQADLFANQQFERLNQAQIPVFLSYGNHDFLNQDTELIAYPQNVHVFDQVIPQTKRLTLADGTEVAIVGFSYDRQAVKEDVVAQFPVREAVDFEIGMVHGSMDSLNAPEANYAPFSKNELLALHYDYWALGHIHKRQILNETPNIIYPGNLQGRHKNEAGEKGFYLVTEHDHQLVPEFRRASVIEWQTATIAVQGEATFEDLKQQILTRTQAASNDHPQFMAVTLQNVQVLASNVLVRVEDGSLLEVVQQALLQDNQTAIWIYELNLASTQALSHLAALDKDYWEQSRQHVFSLANLDQLAGKLLNYDFIATTLTDKAQIAQIQKLTEVLLLENGEQEGSSNENSEN